MSTAYPKQQKAALVAQQAAKAEIKDVPTPQPNAKENEVLIKITATAINPVDWKMRDSGIFVESYPLIMGSDAAGEIVATAGDKASAKFKQGDRVFFQGILNQNRSCTFQQYAVMPADLVAHTPDNITDDQAAGIALASMVVIVGYFNETGVKLSPAPWEATTGSSLPGKGRSVAVLGGSSSVGQYAIQLARLSGFETIVTGSSSAHHDHLLKLGATDVLDRHNATPEAYAKAATAKGHNFSLIYDAISSPETIKTGVDMLKATGKAAEHAKAAKLDKPTILTVYMVEDASQKYADDAGVEIKTVWGIGSAPYIRPQAAAFLDALGGPNGWLAKKSFEPNRPQVVKGGLVNIEDALEKNKAGVSGQKIIVHPEEV